MVSLCNVTVAILSVSPPPVICVTVPLFQRWKWKVTERLRARCVNWSGEFFFFLFAHHLKRYPENSSGVNVHAWARLNIGYVCVCVLVKNRRFGLIRGLFREGRATLPWEAGSRGSRKDSRDWRLVSAKTAWGGTSKKHEEYKVNGLTHMCGAMDVARAQQKPLKKMKKQ